VRLSPLDAIDAVPWLTAVDGNHNFW